jgi:hypothetical protein
MGCGNYSYTNDVQRKLQNASMAQEEVFSQRNMSAEMNIYGKIRECRDSEEHPDTFPIIIALDTTGSMGEIPRRLVTKDFPVIMQKIMEAGVAHPQVCFVGIGDQYTDGAPIQVGQFEASDDLLDKWLKTIWLEGGGGGNGGESYQLAWHFATAHTSVDAYSKRGVKGVLITIGDEPTHKSLHKDEIKRFFGDGCESNISTVQLLDEAQKSWNVFHINLKDWSGANPTTQGQWTELLGEHFINTESSVGEDIPNIIANVVIASYKGDSHIESPLNSSPTSTNENEANSAHLR